MSRTAAPALALALALAMLAGPASAQEQETELNEPCANGKGLPVVTMDDGVSVPIETPVGAALVAISTVDGGDYLVDLAGEPVDTTKTVDVAVTWTNGLFDELSDYDMVANGTTYNSTEVGAERASITRRHCQTISVDEVYTWVGTPADSLAVELSISQFSF